MSRSAKIQLAVLAVNIVFWGGILGYVATADPGDPPSWLDDRAFPEAAEPVCEAAVSRVETFGSPVEVETIEARADLVDRQDVELRAMVAELGTLPLPEGEQGVWVRRWLEDWEVHIADRSDWAARLHAGDDPPFVESTSRDQRTQISKAIDEFAEVNEMPSCATLGDV